MRGLIINIGGVSPQGVQNKDWVDASVVGWIESETKSMEEAWGPATRRSALAFVHIPPSVFTFFVWKKFLAPYIGL